MIYVRTSTDITFKNYFHPSAISVEVYDLLEAFTNVSIDTKRLIQEFIFKVEAVDKQEINSRNISSSLPRIQLILYWSDYQLPSLSSYYKDCSKAKKSCAQTECSYLEHQLGTHCKHRHIGTSTFVHCTQ